MKYIQIKGIQWNPEGFTDEERLKDFDPEEDKIDPRDQIKIVEPEPT